MNFNQALQWRYAPKQLNGKTLPASIFRKIIDAAHLAPSSYGLQPYKLIAVQDKELLQQIHQNACPQPQILGCSGLLVFATNTHIDDQLVDDYIQALAHAKKQSVESLHDFSTAIKSAIESKQSHAEKQEWANRQAYISLGLAVAASAVEKVDAAPMEGFDPKALDELLNLNKQGLTSVVVLALGYRDENDPYAHQPKWRKPHNRFVDWL